MPIVTISNLINNMPYSVDVQVITSLPSLSEPSNRIIVVPSEIPSSGEVRNFDPGITAPGIIPTLIFTLTGDAVTINWTEPSTGGLPISSYVIWGVNTDVGYWILSTPGATIRSATINNLSSGNLYSFAVSAINEVGVGQPSNTITTRPGLPGPPRNLNVAVVEDKDSLDLTWDAPIDASASKVTSYNIYKNSTLIDPTDPILVDATTYTAKNLQFYETYTFNVNAVNEVGEGAPSNDGIGMPVHRGIDSSTLYNEVLTLEPIPMANTISAPGLSQQELEAYAVAQVVSQFIDTANVNATIGQTVSYLSGPILQTYCSAIFKSVDTINGDSGVVTSGQQLANIINDSGDKKQDVIKVIISDATTAYSSQAPIFASLLKNTVNSINVVDDTAAAESVTSIFTSIGTINPGIFAAIINVKDNMSDNMYNATIDYLEQTMSDSSYTISGSNSSLLFTESTNSVTSGTQLSSIIASIANVTTVDGITTRTYAIPANGDPWYLIMKPDVPYTFTYNGASGEAILKRTVDPITKEISNIHLIFNNTRYDVGDSISLGGKDHFLYKIGGVGGTNPDVAPCFVKGTRIMTQSGYKIIEALTHKDRIMTPDGRALTFNLYKRTVKCTTVDTAPYVFPAHVFGRNTPPLPITLSPLHAIQMRKGVWQMGKYAAKTHSSIKQIDIGKSVDYYHIELPNYFTDNIIAEGAIVESFGLLQTKGYKNVYKFNERLGGFTRASVKPYGAKTRVK